MNVCINPTPPFSEGEAKQGRRGGSTSYLRIMGEGQPGNSRSREGRGGRGEEGKEGEKER